MTNWAIEEFCEDAIKSYLAHKVPDGLMNLYVAWTDEEIKYPCAIVHAGKSWNEKGNRFVGPRHMEVSIGVMCEVKKAGAVAARSQNKTLRNAVIAAFAFNPLETEINALAPEGITFIRCNMAETTRAIDAERRLFVSEITLETMATQKVIP